MKSGQTRYHSATYPHHPHPHSGARHPSSLGEFGKSPRGASTCRSRRLHFKVEGSRACWARLPIRSANSLQQCCSKGPAARNLIQKPRATVAVPFPHRKRRTQTRARSRKAKQRSEWDFNLCASLLSLPVVTRCSTDVTVVAFRGLC